LYSAFYELPSLRHSVVTRVNAGSPDTVKTKSYLLIFKAILFYCISYIVAHPNKFFVGHCALCHSLHGFNLHGFTM